MDWQKVMARLLEIYGGVSMSFADYEQETYHTLALVDINLVSKNDLYTNLLAHVLWAPRDHISATISAYR